MTTARRYDDPCGIARALDVVGDRWALLVVRELIFGPKRFIQLRGGLHGVSPNVLSQRLRDLEDAGVVRRDVLDPPADVAIYELTASGRALEPILLELGRWGSQQPMTTCGELSASALLVALKTVFDPAASRRRYLRTSRSTETGSASRWAVARSTSPTAAPSTPQSPSRPTWRRCGRSPSAASQSLQAERDGRLTVHGDRHLAERFARMFPVPGRPSQ